ncbi:UPF0280 family protein [Desulfurella sp.]|uniref:UPF0280 family protein n=1 Tax=Desulfurella sp. TaxID=1962857 RepID=UPI0025C6ADF1|nr:UPF0280 family protein [Desulfurella sp.]
MLRLYRQNIVDNLYNFEITIKESNLFIKTCKNLKEVAFETLYKIRKDLETYIAKSKEFLTSLTPLKQDKNAPSIVQKMIKVSQNIGVGPMACVAGAVSQELGKILLKHCDQCVVENGGDIFLKLNREVNLGLYVGKDDPLNNITIILRKSDKPYGICTSSAKVGPSLSFGSSDVSLIISHDAYFSDCLASACGNIINNDKDLQKAVDLARNFKETIGCCFVCNGKVAFWGDIELGG